MKLIGQSEDSIRSPGVLHRVAVLGGHLVALPQRHTLALPREALVAVLGVVTRLHLLLLALYASPLVTFLPLNINIKLYVQRTISRYLELTALWFLNCVTLFHWNLFTSLIRHLFTFLDAPGLTLLLGDYPTFLLVCEFTFSLILNPAFINLDYLYEDGNY